MAYRDSSLLKRSQSWVQKGKHFLGEIDRFVHDVLRLVVSLRVLKILLDKEGNGAYVLQTVFYALKVRVKRILVSVEFGQEDV